MAGMTSLVAAACLLAAALLAHAQNSATAGAATADGEAGLAASAPLVADGGSSSAAGHQAQPSDVVTEAQVEEEAGGGAALRSALSWLRGRRDARDGGWANHTAAAVLALQLCSMRGGKGVGPGQRWAAASAEGLLAVKQMELELVLHLWRHHEAPITTGKLAQYTLALNAVCRDPKKFYGHDLINMLQHHEAELDYEFAFSSLAVCSSGAHVRKRQIRRLLDIAERVNDHNVDTLSMVLLALKCIVRDHRNRNLDQYVKRPASGLAQQQQPDGSFVGSLHSTALAMQALEAGENENDSAESHWNRSAAVQFVVSRQAADGAFIDIPTTAEVILALGPRSLGAVKDSGCPMPPAVKFVPPLPPALTPKSSHHHHHHKHVSSSNNSGSKSRTTTTSSSIIVNHTNNSGSTIVNSYSGNNNSVTTTTATSTTTVTSSIATATANNINNSNNNNSNNDHHASVSTSNFTNVNLTPLESLGGPEKQPDMVKVTYTIWVHSNISESFNRTIEAERNSTFYNIMLLAAQDDSRYKFEATEWPNGHYVHTLAGYKEEPTSYYFWLLYQTPEMPDPANPPGNQLITPVGVDGLLIDEGNHFLFWYKKL